MGLISYFRRRAAKKRAEHDATILGRLERLGLKVCVDGKAVPLFPASRGQKAVTEYLIYGRRGSYRATCPAHRCPSHCRGRLYEIRVPAGECTCAGSRLVWRVESWVFCGDCGVLFKRGKEPVQIDGNMLEFLMRAEANQVSEIGPPYRSMPVTRCDHLLRP